LKKIEKNKKKRKRKRKRKKKFLYVNEWEQKTPKGKKGQAP
jgi:hypothetical protein